MTFYQELQLNQAGSKKVIRSSKTDKEKYYHIGVYLFKIAITVAFCFVFVTATSLAIGNENSIVGVVVLLCLMVFRNVGFGLNNKASLWLIAYFFAIITFMPHLANMLGPGVGLVLNLISIFTIMVFGCHHPIMSNQSTLVLGYLLFYGYDVSGDAFIMRIIGMAVGCAMTCVVFVRNHVDNEDNITIKEMAKEFDLKTARSRWQLALVLCVAFAVFISEVFGMPRAMWAGIAAMSATVPILGDIKIRVRDRIIGNIAGGLVFLCLFYTLPASIYAFIGVIGGIGVGFSVKYGWQAVFNTFGALAIATELYGLSNAINLRIIQNVFGVVFALAFCFIYDRVVRWAMSKVHGQKIVRETA